MIPNGCVLEFHYKSGVIRSINTDVQTADAAVKWVMEARDIMNSGRIPGGQTLMPSPGFPPEVMFLTGNSLEEIMDVKYVLSDANTVVVGRPELEAAAPLLLPMIRQLEEQPSLKPMTDLLCRLRDILEQGS